MVEQERWECPFHSGIVESAKDLCRRCDEFKDQINVTETMFETMRKEIASRPKTSTMLTVIGLVLVALVALGGWFIDSQNKTIMTLITEDNELKEQDKEFRAEIEMLKVQSRSDNEKLVTEIASIREAVVELKVVLERAIKPTLKKKADDDKTWWRSP